MSFTAITRYTRCGSQGRLIRCPHCASVARIYHLSWSSLVCQGCGASVDKLDFTIGPLVTRRQLRPSGRWCVRLGMQRIYGPTKAEALARAKSSIKRAKEAGETWSISQEVIPGWILPPMVLVFDRNYEGAVQMFNQELKEEHSDLFELSGVDWCGNRVVYEFLQEDEQVDLPFQVYERFRRRLKDWGIEPDLCFRREDPGLGIYLPEIDDDRLEALQRANAEATPAID